MGLSFPAFYQKIGCGTELFDKKTLQIRILYEIGRSTKKISSVIKRLFNMVSNLLHNPNRYGEKTPLGCPRMLTRTDECHICRKIFNSTISLNLPRGKLRLLISGMAVCKTIRCNTSMAQQTIKQVSRLFQYHWDERLNFARWNIITDWNKVWIELFRRFSDFFPSIGPSFEVYWEKAPSYWPVQTKRFMVS